MKTKNLFLLPALIAVLNLLPASPVTAQTFTTLHDFVGYPSEGGYPTAELILSGNTLYGTTEIGGSSGSGTVFKVNTDGTGFTTLHSFTVVSPREYPTGTNSDGANPVGGLILSDNILYGTARFGGSSGAGTVFKVNTDGTAFTSLHSFGAGSRPFPSVSDAFSRSNSDGALPQAGVVLGGNTLYGTAAGGGSSGSGTVFTLNTDGTAFRILHNFAALTQPYYTNSDGANAAGGLVLSGSTLYGTAVQGGAANNGTVFALNSDGTGFTTLHHFAAYPNDGFLPYGELILSGNTLYGTAQGGGRSGSGMIFGVNTDGTGFTILHDFTATTVSFYCCNSDGANPLGGLIVSGATLYGAAANGGSSGNGTVFAVNTDGTDFATLHEFADYPNEGAYPAAGLILSGRNLYGTTEVGGNSGNGTLFKLSVNRAPSAVANVAPSFAISPNEINRFILSPDNAAASVVLDGSQSSDPDNDPLQFAWYADGQTNAVAGGEVATSQFAVGPHSVQLVVSDGYDTATAEVSFEVITLSAAVGQLMLWVDEANLGSRNKQPLLATLSAAMSSFDRGAVTAALNQLSSFQGKVRDQLAPSNPALASEFTAASQQIVTVVSGR